MINKRFVKELNGDGKENKREQKVRNEKEKRTVLVDKGGESTCQENEVGEGK